MVDRRKETAPFSESVPVSLSAGLLLETGAENSSPHARRLVIVKQAKEGKWGIVAGGLSFQPQENTIETLIQTALRELQEETDLGRDQITYWRLLGNIYVPRRTKLSLGFVFQARISGEPGRLARGYTPSNSAEIARVRSFSIDEVITLVKNTSIIYRPEFNVQLLKYWAFDSICDKYDPWEGEKFAQHVAEARTGFPKSVRGIFNNQLFQASQIR